MYYHAYKACNDFTVIEGAYTTSIRHCDFDIVHVHNVGADLLCIWWRSIVHASLGTVEPLDLAICYLPLQVVVQDAWEGSLHEIRVGDAAAVNGSNCVMNAEASVVVTAPVAEAVIPVVPIVTDIVPDVAAAASQLAAGKANGNRMKKSTAVKTMSDKAEEELAAAIDEVSCLLCAKSDARWRTAVLIACPNCVMGLSNIATCWKFTEYCKGASSCLHGKLWNVGSRVLHECPYSNALSCLVNICQQFTMGNDICILPPGFACLSAVVSLLTCPLPPACLAQSVGVTCSC